MNRTKNASRNILFGIILKLIQLGVPFLMRTIMLYFLGVEYLGLNSLFVSILQVLNLTELGVGSAMVYSMYKPIAENDKTTICALMNMYKKYYRIIGTIIAVIGLLIIPFLTYLVKDDIPSDLNIYILYILNLGATVLSYWLFAYKNSLLTAHQRNDITSKISLVVNIIMYGIQAIILCIFKNYYAYLITSLFAQIVTNITTAIVVNKKYPEFIANGNLPKEEVRKINRRIKDLITSKIGAIIVNSADTIVISAFLGLTILAIYQNYFFIFTAINSFISIIFSSCMAGIGNSIIVETKEKNYDDFKKFTLLICWISSFCACCLLCLYQPFMKIWVGEELMLEEMAVFCFVTYFFTYELNQLFNAYKDAAGIWHKDRFRPLVTALSNLVMNLILVQFMGIYGVLLSTVISTLVIGMPWILKNVFTTIFEKSYLKKYLLFLLKNVFLTIIICILSYFICNLFNFNDFLALIINLIVCFIVSNVIYFLCSFKTKEFKWCCILIDRLTKGKIKFLTKIIEGKTNDKN